MFRARKASLLFSHLQLFENPSLIEHDQVQTPTNPFQRCRQCLNTQARCHRCTNKIIQCLKSSQQNRRVRLLSPAKSSKKVKIEPGEKQQIYKLSNVAIRKSREKGKVMTFQQPVLHKNTILYNMNQSILNRPRTGSAKSMYERKQRSLLINFNYIQENKEENDSFKILSVGERTLGCPLSTRNTNRKMNAQNLVEIK